ncbi:16S rRNA pseudouridine516 synthase [Sedimentibacter acidaminivorans]|uniref:Pseudouridine synthase n=1 Tax=Sedimentibacter acidaminivorans TaxID=913099 RepID=A0ABS4G9L8_9FIRM|nr:16S rRNA pseudouridine(516) synthase [Sedimentibacter acidaminivorans]MBP1924364.1 16S rRNA pseudouridine516 synthase [Sedimentibacter acidaminivorans]
MKIRIDKMLSNIGLGSRSQIKIDAKSGCIKINGIIEKNSSRIVDTEKDEVNYKNNTVKYIQYIYLMMNKPQGVVSATEDNYDKTVVDLLDEKDKFYSPFPVGRLDKDTEGLLILTNDGVLNHNLLSPKKHVDKTYYAEVDGEVTEEDVKLFEEGILLINENYKTLPADLKIIESGQESKCYVTVREGKFHQVKRMFLAVGKEVKYLKRISMGAIDLDETLELGAYRHLTEEELKKLM